MSEINVAAVERIVANTIVETARGDPIALASRIVAALADAGYRISPVNEAEDTALGRQPFDELTSEMRPQDTYGDGRGWTFRTGEHGGVDDKNTRRSIAPTHSRWWQATPGLRILDADRPALKGRPSWSLPIQAPARWI